MRSTETAPPAEEKESRRGRCRARRVHGDVPAVPARPPRRRPRVPPVDRGRGVQRGVRPRGGRPTTRWVSRVGADGFGDHLVEAIGGYGVDVSHVRRDPDRPTGVYFRTAGDRADDAHEVAYYRAGSAASAMSPTGVDLDAVRAGRVLHLSGITAALSEDCLTLMRELTAPTRGAPDLLRREPPPGPVGRGIRPGGFAGPGPESGHRLRGRGRGGGSLGPDGRSDGHPGGAPEPTVLVVKQGAAGAVAFRRPPADDRAAGAMGSPRSSEAESGEGGRARHPRSPGCDNTPAQPQPTAPSNPPQEST